MSQDRDHRTSTIPPAQQHPRSDDEALIWLALAAIRTAQRLIADGPRDAAATALGVARAALADVARR
jgi:hypothetical protein